jgi:glutathione S-transferase
MKIYGDLNSGNCLKVKYIADWLGLNYAWVDVDIMKGESRSADFLALNPQGQVPAMLLSDGRALAQSNAILRFLAHGSALLPADPFAQAKIDEWLFWEQYSHEPYVAVARFQMVYLGRAAAERDEKIVSRGEAALDHMEQRLAGQEWLANAVFSVADIALVAYTRLADQGGFDLSARPNLRAWIARVERELRLGPV